MANKKKKSKPNGISFGMAMVILMSVTIILILTTIKIYLSNQIYYESKVVNKMKREVAALKAEKIMLEQSVEALKFKNNMSNIAERVNKIIIDKLGVDEAEVTSEASFTNDLGADSLDTVELIMEFEKEFNMGIPDDQAESISTVGDAVKYIEENAE